MKAKNILMTLLLVTGAIAAKASGYPAELALVSQPVMVYNHSSITVYYDVENIGDYTYRGNVYIYLDPDYGYYYAKEYVRVYPGRIKRIAIDIPAHSISLNRPFTIMPYYEVGRDLYSFTTFEYFEPVRFFWEGPRNEPWVVITIGPRPSRYHRPGTYRYYYDGYRPPMPPPGHGPGTPPPPMDPKHHTYGYHNSNGGYPANHPEWNNDPPKPSNNDVAPSATVRPKTNGGSMSSGNHNNDSNGSTPPPAPNNGGISTRPRVNSGTSSGRTPSSGSNSSSGRVGNSSSNSRPSGTSSSSSNGRVNGSSSGRTPSSGSSNGSNSRVNGSSSNSRPASTSNSSSSRSGSSSVRSSSSSSSSSSSRTSSSGSSSSRTSSSSGRR